MANNLIPEELNALIQQYLTDGVLTDKERQVILNKAEKMGIDRDEIDLYLDAEVQKIDQQTDAAVRKRKGKTCPFCGGSVPQLTDKCPHCGENITPEASSELQEIVDNLEEALVDFKSGNDVAKSKATVERFMRKAKLYYGNNPKIQRLLEEVEMESLEAEKDALKNTFVTILTYNWKITAIVSILLIGFILWGVSAIASAIKGPDALDNPQTCIEAVKKAIDNGDIEKAAGFCTSYTDKHGTSDNDKIATAYAMVGKAYIDNNEYDKAISLVDDGWELEGVEKDLRKSIVDLCINKGEYDKADDYGRFDYDDYDRYFDFVCKCVDHMEENGKSKEEIKKFIDRKKEVPDYHWDSKDYQRLYEYAGLR